MELARLEQELATQRSIANRDSSTPRERETARQRARRAGERPGPDRRERDRLTSKLIALVAMPQLRLP